jgi:hypothetical protein
MSKQQNNSSAHGISRLDRFNLGFEYDKTLQQVKREMRIRTLDKI